MKKMFLIIGISIFSIIILVGIFYFLVISGAIFSFGSNPPKPEITYGEFPFKLTYELDGETKVIEDSVICEFDGFYSLGSAGKYRKWKTSLKSGNERLTLLDLRPLEEINEFGQTMLEMFFSYGSGEYYMGDEQRYNRKPEIRDYVEYEYRNTDGTTGGSSYKADVAYEKYKIKLISWEASEPIQNSFK
jgi:hypothetical protein